MTLGHQTQYGTRPESSYGTDPGAVNERFYLKSTSFRAQHIIVPREGLRGTRSEFADDSRVGPMTCGGTIELQPSPADLDKWLPRILGAAPSGTTFALAETLPSFKQVIDDAVKVTSYLGCKVNRAVFRGTKGGIMDLSLDLIGKSESVGAAGTFPSLSASLALPYIFSDLTFTFDGTPYPVESFELTVDNGLIGERFFNELTIVDLPEGDRQITLDVTLDYLAANHTAFYGLGAASKAGTLALAYGNVSTSFAFPALQLSAKMPDISSKGAIMFPLQFMARQTGSSKEIVVTHDSTP